MNTQMNLQRIGVDKLKPAKYNPRKDLKPGDPAYEKIRRSLTDFGYVDPVIWNEVTGNIVGGHQRYKVLVAEGATEIDCVVVHIENPQDEKALNIALNKAVGEWEPVALADLLADLQTSGYNLGATGFDAAEIDDLFSKVHDKDVKDDDCDIDPEEVQPFVQSGDVWTLGRHRMVCGDATNPEDVALLMDGLKANLVVTDPPYNVAYESADGKSIQNDSMADGKFKSRLRHETKSLVPLRVQGVLVCGEMGFTLQFTLFRKKWGFSADVGMTCKNAKMPAKPYAIRVSFLHAHMQKSAKMFLPAGT